MKPEMINFHGLISGTVSTIVAHIAASVGLLSSLLLFFEDKAAHAQANPVPKFCKQVSPPTAADLKKVGLHFQIDDRWGRNQILRVVFLNANKQDDRRSIAIRAMLEWQKRGLQIQFKFFDSPDEIFATRANGKELKEKSLRFPAAALLEADAHVTIRFIEDGEEYLKKKWKGDHIEGLCGVGKTGCLYGIASDGYSSMLLYNFPKNENAVPKQRLSVAYQVAYHEFGHALGLEHEHQNPARNFKWNREAALKYYHDAIGWDEKTTVENVLDERKSIERYAKGNFVPNSIIIYEIPGTLVQGGRGFVMPERISQDDIDRVNKHLLR